MFHGKARIFQVISYLCQKLNPLTQARAAELFLQMMLRKPGLGLVNTSLAQLKVERKMLHSVKPLFSFSCRILICGHRI